MHYFMRFMLIIVTPLSLTGCAVRQVNTKLFEEFWHDKNQTVTLATYKASEPQMYRVGQEGLVDIAINSAMNNNLNKALRHTDLSWYNNMPKRFADRFKQHKRPVEVLPQQFEWSKKSQELILRQASGNKVLILELAAIGARRNYFGFIPMGAPEAYCVLVGEMLDPKDKTLLWHHRAEIIEPIRGAWDQSPNYPNLTEALQCAIQEAQQELLDSFFSGR